MSQLETQSLMVQVEGFINQGLLSCRWQQGALDITQFGKSDPRTLSVHGLQQVAFL